jgi:hypothetical protein
MGQNIVVVQPPPAEDRKPPRVMLQLPPLTVPTVLKLSLAVSLSVSLGITVDVVLKSKLQPPRCTQDSGCPAGEGDAGLLERFITRCTRDDGFTPTYCAEMWERVTGKHAKKREGTDSADGD